MPKQKLYRRVSPIPTHHYSDDDLEKQILDAWTDDNWLWTKSSIAYKFGCKKYRVEAILNNLVKIGAVVEYK